LRCDPERRPLQIIDHQHGKAAQTFWQILERHENSSSLELIPVTRRTHQLRVHMQALGHPSLAMSFMAMKPHLQWPIDYSCMPGN